MGDRLDHVRSYYASLNTGDADAVAAHFTDDAVHYYTRRERQEGARAIAENAALAVEHLNARWALEHAVGERCLDRGAEFLVFRDGRICEVRAYYHGGVPKNLSGDLVGFDHAARGHTTL